MGLSHGFLASLRVSLVGGTNMQGKHSSEGNMDAIYEKWDPPYSMSLVFLSVLLCPFPFSAARF